MRRLIGGFLLLVTLGLLLALVVLYNKMETDSVFTDDSEVAVKRLDEEQLLEQAANAENDPRVVGDFVDITKTNFASGSIIIENGSDILFNDGFYVSQSCPNIIIGLTGDENIGLDWKKEDSNFGEVSELLNTSGAQKYKVPEKLLAEYNYSVVLWCQDYNHLVSYAILMNEF